MLHRFVTTFELVIAVAGCVRGGPRLLQPARVMEFVIPWEQTRERVTFRIPTSGATVRHLVVDVERGRVWLPLSDAGRIGLIDLTR